ncbi:MAG TPA: NAD(P)H-dependent oxidoreductase [Burkholderiales bacterium]|nr:NAD(P)H-dependent oxidoreductase [Burkholderiales bacterium]
MATIIGISGSLRSRSLNAARLRAAAGFVPGVFKNVIDWLSRPADDIPRVFGGLPVGVMGASPGWFGTLLSQTAWLPVLKTLGTRPWYGQSLYLSGATRLFDASGALADKIRANASRRTFQDSPSLSEQCSAGDSQVTLNLL